MERPGRRLVRQQDDGDVRCMAQRRRRRHVERLPIDAIKVNRIGRGRSGVGQSGDHLVQLAPHRQQRPGHGDQRVRAPGPELRAECRIQVRRPAQGGKFGRCRGRVRVQLGGPAVCRERGVAPALQFEGMAKLQVRVGVHGPCRRRHAIGRLRLGELPGVLQHVAALHQKVGAAGIKGQRRRVGRGRPRAVPLVPQGVSLAHQGVNRRIGLGFLGSGLLACPGWEQALQRARRQGHG